MKISLPNPSICLRHWMKHSLLTLIALLLSCNCLMVAQTKFEPIEMTIVDIHHTEFAKATTVAAEFARLLAAADTEQALRILGPAPAPLARIKGEHRLQVLIKTKNR